MKRSRGANTKPQLDWLVLTAANRAQACGYEAELHERERRGGLAVCKKWMVIADPGDRRVGSGGSTFAVLAELARRLAAERGTRQRVKRTAGPPVPPDDPPPRAGPLASLFAGKKILIIHSGGDSRRLPAYAAQGKVFLPLPRETADGRGGEREAALFDLVLEDLAAVPLPDEGRVLIATGDVLLGVARHRSDLDRPGLTGVAFATDVARGSRHGVYVADAAGTVTDFLQKPDEATAAARGAIGADGRVLVDMGLLSLDPASVERWLAMAGVSAGRAGVRIGAGLLRDVLEGRAPAIDLYEHVLIAVSPRLGFEEYLEEVGGAKTRDRDRETRRVLGPMFRALHGSPFHVAVVPESDFVHIGTTRELLEIVPRDPRVNRAPETGAGRVCVYNSAANGDVRPLSRQSAAVIEGCDIRGGARLGGANLVVGWPREAAPLDLPRGWGAVWLPVGRELWSAAAFGADDDCKTPVERGGTIGGERIDTWLDRTGLSTDDLWDSPSDRTLWTARLWVVGPVRRVLRMTKWLWQGERPPAPWRREQRTSLAELIRRVDHGRMIARRAELQRQDRLARAASRVRDNRWIAARRIADDATRPADARALLAALVREANQSGPLDRARLWRTAAVIRHKFPSARATGLPANCGRAAFAEVARAVARNVDLAPRPREARIPADQVVWVTTPVRIDFAGGWSDTPPICSEVGGAVVNAAITLNGQYPVQVMARLSDERRIRISSVDLGASVVLRDAAAVLDYCDPHDWAAIAKAALVLAGVAPASAGQSLGRWLERLGGGLDLTMFSALPKGSGLGTSSVLGAALLACLDRVHGHEPDAPSLIRRTSVLEQMMSTAGGWQDQAGGITPGAKLLRTEAGPEQDPAIVPLPFDAQPGSALASRMLLYYTGYRRLAADILHGVVGAWLEREPRVISVVDRLKACALEMKGALAKGDVDEFAHGVLANWELKKEIDPGSTNARIEALFRPLTRYLSGYELPGAGGGGFLFMIARDEEAARAVRSRLLKHPPNSLARFYDFAVDREGLRVSVL